MRCNECGAYIHGDKEVMCFRCGSEDIGSAQADGEPIRPSAQATSGSVEAADLRQAELFNERRMT